MHIFMQVLMSISCKNDVTSSIVSITRLYVIEDIMKIKLATVCAVIYQPINH